MNGYSSKPVVCRVLDLTVHYEIGPQPLVAANNVSFDLFQGETLGLVGESGCGKSTTAMAMLRLLHTPGRVTRGSVLINDVDVMRLTPAALRAFRWRHLALIPQGAMNALNPVMRVEKQITDAIMAHGAIAFGRRHLRERVIELFNLVGLPPAVARLYPHELSGGMKQRVCIAMAVALNPTVVIADEPTSALDVVVQRLVAQNLLHIKRTLGNSMILIGHDMGLMAHLTDRIAVMYAGRVVEIAPTLSLFKSPLHPYTQQLIESVPSIKIKKPLRVFPGGPPDLRNLPPGCPFAPRCPKAMPHCTTKTPILKEYTPSHQASCHALNKLEAPQV